MKSHMKNALLIATLVTLGSILPLSAQRSMPSIPSMPRYTPPPTPRYNPPSTPHYNPPAQRPASAPVQRPSTTPVQRPATTPVQRPSTPAPQRPASMPSTPSRPAPSVSTTRAPQPASTPKVDRAQQQRQQKEEARAQQQRSRQDQNQKKQEASRQKQEAKAREKQQKEQARQEKERMKQEQKAQKEAARQHKNAPVKSAPQMASRTDSAPKTEAPATKTAASHSGSAYHAPEVSAIASRNSSGSMSLTRAGSESTIGQLNSARSSMNGINRKPLPAGDVTVHPNGRLTLNAAGGRQYGLRRDGSLSSYRDASKSVNFDRNGKVTSLRTANLEERRGPHGQRTIITHGADHTTFVSTGRHSGYAERNVVISNHTYIQRTTVINNRIVTSNFVAFNYGGVPMVRFVTPVFFAPAFYGWAFYPWGVPVHFAFGWAGAPWYVGPNPYFAAYPTYPGAAWWLTDYAIGETLNDAYQLDADAATDDDANYSADATSADADDAASDMVAADATTPISNEIKESIAEQVKQELSYDSAASTAQVQETAYDEVSAVLNRPNQIFIVSSSLDVATADERVCSLQAGDILRLGSESTGDNALVPVRVASSKRTDCPAGTTVTISMSDLQEMHNNFRARIESGLGQLQSKQGQDGLPAIPASAVSAPPRPTLSADASDAAPDMTTAFDGQRQQADLAEAQVMQAAFSQGQ